MTDKPAPSVNEAALLEVVKAARQLQEALDNRVKRHRDALGEERTILASALADLDRLTP